jgi:hypothetical protein
MADISNVINVSLLAEGRLAARDNLNVVGIITSETGFLSTAKRFEIYRDAPAVATDFGTSSQAHDFATTFFGTQPNSVNAGGHLVIGFWRAVDENVAESAATLAGAELSEARVVGQLQSVSDGAFDFTVDGGAEQNIAGLDFQTSTTLAEVVTVIDTAITGATATLDNIGVVITSDTTGATSLLTFITDPGTGTFIGSIVGLAQGTGAVLTQGAAAAVLTAESKVDAITEIKAQTNIFGGMFIDKPTSIEAKALAEWAQANNTLVYDVFSDAANLVVNVTNVVWDIKLSSLTNYRMLFSTAANRKLASAYMARTHTVNFNAENSALTMHLKELPVTAESYTEGQITAAKTVGLDLYTTIKLTPIILTSGANDFVDNRYNLIGYVDALQTDLFNLLKQTSTKIAQIVRGVNQLIDQAEKTTRGFVRAGVFAPGTWSSPDTFGDLDTFNRNIEQNGFYFLAGRLSDQPQADRQARKSPVLQGAVKNAGAIHSVDVIINFNI